VAAWVVGVVVLGLVAIAAAGLVFALRKHRGRSTGMNTGNIDSLHLATPLSLTSRRSDGREVVGDVRATSATMNAVSESRMYPARCMPAADLTLSRLSLVCLVHAHRNPRSHSWTFTDMA